MRTVFTLLIILFVFPQLYAQKNKHRSDFITTDANTALHTLPGNYVTPYNIPDTASVHKVIDRIFNYISSTTPIGVVDSQTSHTVTLENLTPSCRLRQGDFRIASYEWSVVYTAMQHLTNNIGDNKYRLYSEEHLRFLVDAALAFRILRDSTGYICKDISNLYDPRSLDDCGALCNAMLLCQQYNDSIQLNNAIEKYIDFLMYGSYRLADGTIARTRPHYNTVWVDDLYMGIPALARYGHLNNNTDCLNEACKQLELYHQKMRDPYTGLLSHCWINGCEPHIHIPWGRANGWAVLAMCDVLDEIENLKSKYNEANAIKINLANLLENFLDYQDVDGFWHQIINRPETYEETSVTAMFTYAIAHAVNEGWIDARAFGPAAIAGWNALQSKVTPDGHVEGTCVGTGMGLDRSFYAHRPRSSAAAQGYGATLLAAAEIYRLIQTQCIRINDSAIHFYNDTQQSTPNGIYNAQNPSRPNDTTPGSSRHGNQPVMFIIGDSTVKNGRGIGQLGMWGWGSFFKQYILNDVVSVENHGMGGRSSRTYISEGLWNNIVSSMQAGDYLIIQFGHNDIGSVNTGRARASLPGIGNESEYATNERTGRREMVYTYGYYLRQFIRQAKALGVHVLVLSPTPFNKWENGKITRYTDTYNKWAHDVAKHEGVDFIDLNSIIADMYDEKGQEYTQSFFFKDNVHTSYIGAKFNCQFLAQQMTTLGPTWNQLINHTEADKRPRRRTLLIAGDSTAKTYNTQKTLQRGWGQMIEPLLGGEIIVENFAEGGRSTKTFLNDGHWDNLKAHISKGDIVAIQFGHNDSSSRPERHTSHEDYCQNLCRMIDEVRALDATPVIITSIVMRTFDGTLLTDNRLRAYPAMARKVATEKNVMLIDANLMTHDLVISLGPEESKSLYLHLNPGDDETFPNGTADDTHLSQKGAQIIAQYIAQQLIEKLNEE